MTARSPAIAGSRAFSLLELMVACGVLAALAALLVIPAYLGYARAREVDDAAAEFAADVAYLERFAQDSAPFEGATIEVESEDPLRYTCYSGRPSAMDPQSYIRDVLFKRSFDNVSLVSGPLHHESPLLFARNGSIQYVAGGQWSDQHVPVSIVFSSRIDRARTAAVALNPFTGAVTAP